MDERRSTSQFTEKLSWLMAIVAALGGMYVILDPVITLDLDWVEIKLGGDGFAEQLKGAVVALILIEGWKAVKEYWLGSSAGTVKSAETIQRIAEAAPSTSAAAVAAATGTTPTAPLVTPGPATPDGIIPAVVATDVQPPKETP